MRLLSTLGWMLFVILLLVLSFVALVVALVFVGNLIS